MILGQDLCTTRASVWLGAAPGGRHGMESAEAEQFERRSNFGPRRRRRAALQPDPEHPESRHVEDQVLPVSAEACQRVEPPVETDDECGYGTVAEYRRAMSASMGACEGVQPPEQ